MSGVEIIDIIVDMITDYDIFAYQFPSFGSELHNLQLLKHNEVTST